MTPLHKPERGEVDDYYFTYIDKVPEGDIRRIVAAQAGEALAFLESIPDEKTLHRYAPGKWSIRDVLAHVNDTERLFAYRAFWFARGFDTALPSFDQDVAARTAGADVRAWQSHLDEFRAVRAATVALLDSLPDEAWGRAGVASGYPFTVRGLAYITAGHVAHHLGVLRDRYL
jgi:DinB superfamily